MINQIHTLLLIISVTPVSSNHNLQQLESLIPSRSTFHIIGDFNIVHETSREAKIFKFLLHNQHFLKVLFHHPTNHHIQTNLYYGFCKRKIDYVFSNYFGHSTIRISFIFRPDLGSNYQIGKLRTVGYCRVNPTYIFLILSRLNHKTFEPSPHVASTTKWLSMIRARNLYKF